jgi:hypothetical protein
LQWGFPEFLGFHELVRPTAFRYVSRIRESAPIRKQTELQDRVSREPGASIGKVERGNQTSKIGLAPVRELRRE